MVHESFGARLRRQRERKRVTLSAIAERTKIHQPLLEELERDEVSHWPSGIFRRAFIRAYAEAIGLQPDDVVREFLTVYPDPVEAPKPVGQQPGLLFHGRHGMELVLGADVECERGLLGMNRTDLRQAASAGSRVFRPGIELAGVSQRGLEQQLVNAVADGGRIGQVCIWPGKSGFLQCRWGLSR